MVPLIPEVTVLRPVLAAILIVATAGPALANSWPHQRNHVPSAWVEMAITPAKMNGTPPAGGPVYWRNGQRVTNCASRVVPVVDADGQIIGHTRGFFGMPDQD